MMTIKYFFINLLVLLFLCSACSDDGQDNAANTGDHVWKEQTDTINKAKEVEGMLKNAEQNTRKSIDEMSE